MASRFQNHQINQQRQKEDFLRETNNYLKSNVLSLGQEESENRVERMRRNARNLQKHQEEQWLKEEEKRNQFDREKVSERQREFEFREQQRKEEMMLLDAKKRQLLHIKSDELRGLEARLKEAYMNKERVIQLEERDLKNRQMKELETRLDHANNEYQKILEEKEIARHNEQKRQVLVNIEDHRRQMELLEQERELERQRAEKEKEEIEAIVQRIKDDDIRSAHAKIEKQKQTRKEIDEFLSLRDSIKQKAREEAEAEERRLVEAAETKRRQDMELELEKKRRTQERNERFYNMASEVVENTKKQELLEQYRIQLYMEEEEERQRLDEQARKQRRQQIIDDMVVANEQIIAAHERAQLLAREEAKRYADLSRAEVLRQRDLEREAAQRLREKKMLLYKDIDDTISAKRAYYDNLRLQREEEEADSRQSQLAEEILLLEEKRRLLLSHQEKLGKFFPTDLMNELESLNAKLAQYGK